MTRKPFSLARVIALCAPLALVASCGKGSEANQNTRVGINPISVGITTPTTTLPTVVYFFQPYQVTLTTPSGASSVGAKANLVRSSNSTMYAGLVDLNSATISCTAEPKCTAAGFTELPAVYEQTVDSTGTIRVTMVVAIYSGSDGTFSDLEVFSGTGYNKTDVVAKCVEGAFPCP